MENYDTSVKVTMMLLSFKLKYIRNKQTAFKFGNNYEFKTDLSMVGEKIT